MFRFVSDKVTKKADLNVRNNRGGARLAGKFACVPVGRVSDAATPLQNVLLGHAQLAKQRLKCAIFEFIIFGYFKI